jgi:hypothetical protein
MIFSIGKSIKRTRPSLGKGGPDHRGPPGHFQRDNARDARITAQNDIAVVSVNVSFTAAPDY